MLHNSGPARFRPSGLRVEEKELLKDLMTHRDCQMRPAHNAPPTPNFSSFEEEETRGRKRRRTSVDMVKRNADAALGLRDLSLPPSPATREPSRKRSQSPSKTRNELERCKPAVVQKSASYQPQHPATEARIKRFVQTLADESGIFTAAEKVYIENGDQDWTQALRVPGEMLLKSHNARYPPLNWDRLGAIHTACERAIRELQHEDMWTTAVVVPLLQEALQPSTLEARLVTSVAICSDYIPTLHRTFVDRRIDIVLGFEHSTYRSLGSYLLNWDDKFPRVHPMESGFPDNIFIAAGLEIKRFGSSGEGEAVVQMMVWASSVLKFLKQVLEEQWTTTRGQHKIPELEDLPLLALNTFVGDRWEFYVAYWEREHDYLQDRYVEVIQGPFPVLSRSTSSLYNIARSVRQDQRFCAWAEEDFTFELLHIFGVDWAAVKRQVKGESIMYPNE